ncbi:Pyridoxal-dependent decarboxylase domain-containing protein 1 [Chytridiales sp. JEL 0842]|nr:Pyridoxal-dependent decarboxylase domain-containing protein 1 [Chytridiales sp. JEL 0842]
MSADLPPLPSVKAIKPFAEPQESEEELTHSIPQPASTSTATPTAGIAPAPINTKGEPRRSFSQPSSASSPLASLSQTTPLKPQPKIVSDRYVQSLHSVLAPQPKAPKPKGMHTPPTVCSALLDKLAGIIQKHISHQHTPPPPSNPSPILLPPTPTPPVPPSTAPHPWTTLLHGFLNTQTDLDSTMQFQAALSFLVGLATNPFGPASAETQAAIERELESACADSIRSSLGFYFARHVHFHGSVDFGSGRCAWEEVQVYRTATHVALRAPNDMSSNATQVSGSASSDVPVFYIANTAEGDAVEQTILTQWGLISGSAPTSSSVHSNINSTFGSSIGSGSGSPTPKIRRVPCTSNVSETIDPSALLMYLNEDVTMGRKPCMVVCVVGTSSLCQVDDLVKLREICSNYGVWMHVKGDQVIPILMSSLPTLAASHNAPATGGAPSTTSQAKPKSPSRGNSQKQMPPPSSPTTLLDALRMADSVDLDLASESGSHLFPFSMSTLHETFPTWMGKLTVFVNVDPRRVDPILNLGPKPVSDPSSPISLTTTHWRPTPTHIKYTLPVWMLLKSVDILATTTHTSTAAGSGWDSTRKRLLQIRELAWTCAYKLSHASPPSTGVGAGSGGGVVVCAGAVEGTQMGCCFRFGGVGMRGEIERLGSNGGLLVGGRSGGGSPRSVGGGSPRTPTAGLGGLQRLGGSLGRVNGSAVSAALGVGMELAEAWEKYKKQMEDGTKFIFSSLPEDLREALGLDLRKYRDTSYIRYRPWKSNLEPNAHADLLIGALSQIISTAERIESSYKFQPVLQRLLPKMCAIQPHDISDDNNIPTDTDAEPHNQHHTSTTTNITTHRYAELFYVPPTHLLPTPNTPATTAFFAGLGAIRYIPSYIDAQAATYAPWLLESHVREDLEKMNRLLVEEVKKVGGTGGVGGVVEGGKFWMEEWGSLEEGEEEEERGEEKGAVCLRIGLDKYVYTEERLKEILDVIVKKGRELESLPEFRQTIEHLIKLGIQRAEQELKKNDMSDEIAVLRNLPIVGTVLSFMGMGVYECNIYECIALRTSTNVYIVYRVPFGAAGPETDGGGVVGGNSVVVGGVGADMEKEVAKKAGEVEEGGEREEEEEKEDGDEDSSFSNGPFDDVAAFDRYYQAQRDDTATFLDSFKSTFDCPGFTGGLRYHLTTLCALEADIAHAQTEDPTCNPDGPAPVGVCATSSNGFTNSLKSIFANPDLCNQNPSAESANQRKTLTDSLDVLNSKSNNNEGCVRSIPNSPEESNCGFYAAELALTFCNSLSPANVEACCASVPGFTPSSSSNSSTTTASSTVTATTSRTTPLPTTSSTTSTTTSTVPSAESTNTDPKILSLPVPIFIAGSISLFVLLTALAVGLCMFLRRRRRQQLEKETVDSYDTYGRSGEKMEGGSSTGLRGGSVEYKDVGFGKGASPQMEMYNNESNNNNSNSFNNMFTSNPQDTPLMAPAPVPGLVAAGQMMSENNNNNEEPQQIAETMEVVFNYVPNLSDEIYLYVGDPIIVKCKFDDGWGYGFNLTTKLEGSFPLACVAPYVSPPSQTGSFSSNPQQETNTNNNNIDEEEGSSGGRGESWMDGSGRKVERESFSIRQRGSSMYGPPSGGGGYRESQFTVAATESEFDPRESTYTDSY